MESSLLFSAYVILMYTYRSKVKHDAAHAINPTFHTLAFCVEMLACKYIIIKHE